MTIDNERPDYENPGSHRANEIIAFFEKSASFALEAKATLEILARKAFAKAKDEIKEIRDRLTTADFVVGGAGMAVLSLAAIVFLSGFLVVGYQAVLWLKDGVWTELPLLAIFNYFFEGSALQSWLVKPESWYGLHELARWILENIPLSLTLIVDGALAVFIVSGLMAMAGCFRYYQFKKPGKS